MANYKISYTFEIVDINGDTAVMRIPSLQIDTRTLAQLATTSGALGGGINALTNGKTIKTGVSIDFVTAQYLVGTTPPNNAEYSSVTDGARLQFSNSLRERMSLTVPAPLEHVFGTNTNIVDSTQTDVAALIALIAADAQGASGTAFNLYEGGVKSGRGARRRRTSLIP
jgi:hypothetical protein